MKDGRFGFLNYVAVMLITFYIFGIFMANFNNIRLFVIASSVLLVSVIIFMIFLFKRREHTACVIVLLCLITFLIGAAHLSYTAANRRSELRNFIGEKAWVYGTVVSTPHLTQKENHYAVNVEVYKIEQKGKITPVSGKVCVYVRRYETAMPSLNDDIYFFAELEAPDYKVDSFDYGEYLRTKDIYVTGFTHKVYSDPDPVRSDSYAQKLKFIGRRIKSFMLDRFDTIFSYDKDALALIKGILLGEKSDYSDNLAASLSLAGFSHIAAVSGLHMNILFGAFCGLLGFFRVRRKLVAALALPVILLFAAVTDFSPSVCRAAIMLSMYIIALITKSQYDSLTALFISALIILIVNPFALFGVSFILSFVSTLAILLLYGRINRIFAFAKRSIILKTITSSVALSICAFIGTAPFIAYYFGILSFSSIIANIWVIPLCGPIFVCGYILNFIGPFLPGFLRNIILYPLAAWLEIIIRTAEIFSHLDFMYVEIPAFPAWYIPVYYIALALWFMPNHKKKAGA